MKGKFKIQHSDKTQANFLMSGDIKKGKTIHLILEVTDNGTPQLTRYQWAIITAE